MEASTVHNLEKWMEFESAKVRARYGIVIRRLPSGAGASIVHPTHTSRHGPEAVEAYNAELKNIRNDYEVRREETGISLETWLKHLIE